MAQSFKKSPENSSKLSTLVELLRYRSSTQPEQTAFTFLTDGKTESTCLTYQELDWCSCAIAQALTSQLTSGLQCIDAVGKRALLLYPPGLEFIKLKAI